MSRDVIPSLSVQLTDKQADSQTNAHPFVHLVDYFPAKM